MLEKLAEILEIAPTDFFTDPPPPIPGRPSENESALDALDVVVGLRLCARRRSLGLSQRKLGEAIGVSFRQIQKYERGMTRIAVATLVRVAAELDAPHSFSKGSAPSDRSPSKRHSMGAMHRSPRHWHGSKTARFAPRFGRSFEH